MDLPEPVDLKLDATEQLFGRSGQDPRLTALTLGSDSQHVPYALGFKEAGDALIRQGLTDHTQDLVLFPTLYCYRHALELTLKDLIYLGQKSEGASPCAVRTHNLALLWPRARAVIERAWPKTAATQTGEMESLILELDAVDLEGEQFRYDRDRHGLGRPLPPELQRVDLGHVFAVMHKLFGLLFAAIDGIEDMLAAMEAHDL